MTLSPDLAAAEHSKKALESTTVSAEILESAYWSAVHALS